MSRQSLRDDLIAVLPHIQHSGGSGSNPDYPEFDLMPFDFLEFAEEELKKSDTASRINCVAHLKRAIDCELDTFFCVLNLRGIIQKRNLKFEKKTDLVRAMGLVSPRSLTKLNQIRNKLEHEYAAPDLADLELYFDLCTAFVSVIEGYIFMFSFHTQMDWEETKEGVGGLSVEYDLEKQTLKFEVGRWKSEREYVFTPDAIEDFAWAFKVYFLLCRATSLITTDRVAEELSKERPNK